MMRFISTCLLTLLMTMAFGQEQADSVVNTLEFDIFDPEDSLGNRLFEKLVDYERFGHFGSTESRIVEKKYVESFNSLFVPGTMLPEDMTTDTLKVNASIPVEDYAQMAFKRGYFPYILFIQREATSGKRIDTTERFETTVHMFKLFEERALIGEKCRHAAEYMVTLNYDNKGDSILISNVVMPEGGEHSDFILGKYGRHIYSPILVSNNVRTLVQELPPPYVPTSKPTLSNFFLRAGIQYTDIFSPEPFARNLDPAYSYSGTEEGRSFGFFYQKAFARKDIFGLTVGVEYEQNSYQFRHDNAYFVYDSDENGDPLTDLEGSPYDLKHVFVHSHEENGTINYIKPEIGMFVNLGRGWFNVQLVGSVGNAFLMESNFDATSVVSYQGEIEGVGVIEEPALGFYQDLEVNTSGPYAEVQSFMFYKGGLGIDFIIDERVGISLLAEYKSSFTYMIRKNSAGKPFLDPDTGEGFDSQLNFLNESRNYQGISVQAGIKIFLNEKR